MKLVIADITRIDVEGDRVRLRGSNGHLEVSAFAGELFSVLYRFDHGEPSTSPPGFGGLDGLMFAEEAAGRRIGWDRVTEEGAAIELRSGRCLLTVDRATGTVAVHRDGRLIHGGPVGTSETVLPQFPLRANPDPSTGGAGRAKLHLALEAEDRFYGLGEKSGPFDRRNRRFKMYNRDALGYDARISDPLYKSIPFLIKHNPLRGTICGLLFPSFDIEEIDLGVESLYYYAVSFGSGPYGYYLMVGDSYRDLLSTYTALTGRPALPPLFTFGFFGSSMSYTEGEDAEARVSGYFAEIERHRIPCEGIYFSSGYAKSEQGRRHTLVWNRTKFTDPRGFIRALRSRGYRVCCNIKPGFLVDHPWYEELARKGYFLRNRRGETVREYYWGGDASFIDLFNPSALAWWKDRLRELFVDYGVEGIWNDNNELEIDDEEIPASRAKAAYPLLMAKASYDLLREAFRHRRPWVISRSGAAGMQRYARTWTGDNVSSFASLRFNILMGLNLGMSGIPFYGHDIGGFFGPRPSRELLVRWCQCGVFHPRFVIHSWNDDGSPTEPWTYPEALPTIRALIELRYLFMPYTYNVAIEAARTGAPMERPLFLEFPQDHELAPDDPNYLFGSSILSVSPVVEGAPVASVRLPAGARWYDPSAATLFTGGRTLTVPAEPASAERRESLSGARLSAPTAVKRYFVRAGSIVPVSPGLRKLETSFFSRLEFLLFPWGDSSSTYCEDDGSSDQRDGWYAEYRLSVAAAGPNGEGPFRLQLSRLAAADRDRVPEGRSVGFVLPRGFLFVESSFHAGEPGVETGGPLEVRPLFSEEGSRMELRGVREYPPFSIEFRGNYPSVVDP